MRVKEIMTRGNQRAGAIRHAGLTDHAVPLDHSQKWQSAHSTRCTQRVGESAAGWLRWDIDINRASAARVP